MGFYKTHIIYNIVKTKPNLPTQKEAFEMFNIDVSHDVWTENDEKYACELFRITHGRTPNSDDEFFESSVVFLSNVNANVTNEYAMRQNYGNLYITAKRAIYKYFKDSMTCVRCHMPTGNLNLSLCDACTGL